MSHPPNDDDLAVESSRAIHQLNHFFSDETLWFPTWAKKELVDLFGLPIPSGTLHYQRSIGRSSRPLMRLAQQSVVRLVDCLSRANERFAVLADVLAEDERRSIEVKPSPQPGKSA